MVLMVRERPVAAGAKIKIGVNFRQFPKAYWRYLLATADIRARQLQQRVPDLAHARCRRLARYHDPDLRGIQSRGGAHLLSGRLSSPTRGGAKAFYWPHLRSSPRPIWASLRPGISPLSPGFLRPMAYIRVYSAPWARRLRQTSCRRVYGQAALAGTAPPWVCFNL